MNWNETAKKYAEDCKEELLGLIEALCKIPAPSNKEERRAEFCRGWFASAGFDDVVVDDALNVVCKLNYSEEKPVIVFMAHTDTVFPDLEPFHPERRDGKIFCPGVGDDTANLAILMLCARFCLSEKARPDCGILFVANSGEEGLGNLKGSRKIMETYKNVKRLISFDGKIDSVVNDAVGSDRYSVKLETEGGHSFSDFGNSNAIHLLSRMISDLYDVKLPSREGSKTTYNVGIIGGGTSVNTIAQSAEMLYEYRSNNRVCLGEMRAAFEAIAEKYGKLSKKLTVEPVGSRPCTGDVNKEEQEALTLQIAGIVEAVTGKLPDRESGSTDCNIPLSLGIPAVCVGGYHGGGTHTREEWVQIDSLSAGMEAILRIVLSQI